MRSGMIVLRGDKRYVIIILTLLLQLKASHHGAGATWPRVMNKSTIPILVAAGDRGGREQPQRKNLCWPQKFVVATKICGDHKFLWWPQKKSVVATNIIICGGISPKRIQCTKAKAGTFLWRALFP